MAAAIPLIAKLAPTALSAVELFRKGPGLTREQQDYMDFLKSELLSEGAVRRDDRLNQLRLSTSKPLQDFIRGRGMDAGLRILYGGDPKFDMWYNFFMKYLGDI